MTTEKVAKLEARLGAPQRSERLEALAELVALEQRGEMPPPPPPRGVNVHVHTNESFSIFRSPSEAVWLAHRAGLYIFGINDHYTIAGHEEFRAACRLCRLKACFSIEAVALSERHRDEGILCNDPNNPGRTYLCGKGVLHDLPPGSREEADLARMREAISRRNAEMVRLLNEHIASCGLSLRLSYEDVLALTPSGNTTERHVAQALAEALARTYPAGSPLRDAVGRLVGDVPEEVFSSDARFQNMLRDRLLKAGGPAFVEESPEAFLSWERMVALWRAYGAIPTYPVLGNPVTGLERDLPALFEEIERYGMFAVETISHRNTRERFAQVLQAAQAAGLPVFEGTEHNTKTPMPLLSSLALDPEFEPYLTRSAELLVGHDVLGRLAGFGYLDERGELSIPDRRAGLDFFAYVGSLDWDEEMEGLLASLGQDEALALLTLLYAERAAKRRFALAPGASSVQLAAALEGIGVERTAVPSLPDGDGGLRASVLALLALY